MSTFASGTIITCVPYAHVESDFMTTVAQWYTSTDSGATWTTRKVKYLNAAPNGTTRRFRWEFDTSLYSANKYWLRLLIPGLRFFRTSESPESTAYPTETNDYIAYIQTLAGCTELTQEEFIAEGTGFNVISDNAISSGVYYSEIDIYPTTPTNDYWYHIIVPYPYIEVRPTTRTLTENLTGCTTSLSPGTYNCSSKLTMYLTCEDGYKFTSTSEIVVDSKGITPTITLTSDTTATVVIPVGYYPVTVTATPTLESGFQITVNVEGCTCNIASGKYAEGTVLDFTFTPNGTVTSGGYAFRNAPVFSDSSIVANYNEETGVYTATYTVAAALTVTAVAVKYVNFDVSGVSFCTCNITATDKIFIDESFTVDVQADSGYYFASVPYIVTQDDLGQQIVTNMVTTDSGDYKQHYSLTVAAIGSQGTKPIIQAVGEVIPEVDKYGIVIIYNPTPDELKTISNKRFLRFTDGSGGVTFIDVGNYVADILKLFVHVPVYNRQNVVLGGYDMEQAANVVLRDIVTTDCGMVTINPHFNNVMDYENTDIKIYLPFRGFETLDNSDVMGKTIHLVYKTNVVNGDTLICVFIVEGEIETLVNTFECNASFKIPYILNGKNEIDGKLNVQSSYLYGFTPYIYLRYETENNTAAHKATSDFYAQLSSLTGYNEIDIDEFTIPCTAAERKEIISLLKEGVIL